MLFPGDWPIRLLPYVFLYYGSESVAEIIVGERDSNGGSIILSEYYIRRRAWTMWSDIDA